MPIKLSICIATRNRGDFIGETLLSIVSQATEGIEILVLDGASTDNTPAVVAELQTTIPFLRYIRKECNGGIDRDYDEVVGEAAGEYCWLMSDDDLLMPGAIAAVMRGIDAGNCLVVVNSEVRTFDFSRKLDPNRLRQSVDRNYRSDELQRLFTETSAYLSYIGAVVIRRDLWMERQREPYYGSYFIHVGVIFQALLPGSALVISKPLISVRFGNTTWRPREFEIRMVRWTELIWSLGAIEESSRAFLYQKEPWRSAKSLFFYRAKGTYGPGEYRRWVRPRVRSARDQMVAWAIAHFPGVAANLAGLVYCSFDYRDSNIHFLDMKASRFYFRNWAGAAAAREARDLTGPGPRTP